MSEVTTTPSSTAPSSTQAVAPTNTASKEAAVPIDVAASKEAPEMYAIKINGKERQVGIDELIRLAALGGGANEKFEQAAKARKEAEDFIRMLKTDPKKVLTSKHLGIDFKSIAEDFLWEQMQAESLTPEQRRQREMEAELAKYKDSEAKQKKDEEARQIMAAEQREIERYDRSITEGLSASGLPKTPATVRMVAKYLGQALDAGYDAEVSDVIPLVRQDYMASIQELLGATDGDTLLALLGDGVANKMRKADLARLRASAQAPTAQPQAAPAKSRGEGQNKKLNKYDWQARINEKLGR